MPLIFNLVLQALTLRLSNLQGGSAYAGHGDDDKSAHTNGAGVGGGGNYASKVSGPACSSVCLNCTLHLAHLKWQ